MSLPFHSFAMNWFRVRESKGIDRITIANRLGLSLEEYNLVFESGERTPSQHLILEGCQFLEIDPDRPLRWISYATKVVDKVETPLKGSQAYVKALHEIIEKVEKKYEKLSDKKISQHQRNLLAGIQRDVLKLFALPVLPMNYILIREGLNSIDRSKVKYLHECKDFILEGETLAGFIARDAYIGLFVFYAANKVYFKEAPCKSVVDCFNLLTIEQFENLFFMATYHYGLYEVDEEIPYLQQMNDFTSLAALMVKELGDHLPDNVNPDHLYLAALGQCLGKYTLFYIFHPILVSRREADYLQTNISEGLNDILFSCIITDLHPLISCMVTSNFDLPEDVLETLRFRHKQPIIEVTPLCAALKIINEYVDSDFPVLTMGEVETILSRYPQVDISPDVLYKTTNKLQKMKKKLYERSSQLLEQKVQQTSTYIDEKIRKKYEQKNSGSPQINFDHPPKRHEFRFDTGLQNLLLNVAYKYQLDFTQSILSPRKGENLSDFQKRVSRLFLKFEYATSKDIEITAQKAGQSVEEVEKILFS